MSVLPREIRELIAAIPHFLGLLLRLLGDGRVAAVDKAILAAAIVYTLSPLDLMPDFLPLLGQLDDLYLLALAIDRLITNAGADVVRSHWRGSDRVLESLCGSLDRLARYLPGSVQRRLEGEVQAR